MRKYIKIIMPQKICTTQPLKQWVETCEFLKSLHFYVFSYKKWTLMKKVPHTKKKKIS